MTRRTKAVFTASILLNLILICAGSVMMYRMCGDKYRMSDDLSPAGQATLQSAFRDGRAQIGPLIDEARAHRAKVEAAITAEQFDLETYRAAVAPMLESRAGIGRAKAEVMGRTLSSLSVEDRRLIALRMLDRLEGRRGPGRGREAGGGPGADAAPSATGGAP